jgi:hypothetical protein
MAVARQAASYDKRHREEYFLVGEEVLLLIKNIRSWRPSKKLDQKYKGPFKVKDVVSKQAYLLQLPKSYRCIYPVFHVSLLKKYTRRPGASIPDPQLVVVDDEEEWEVEEVLAHCLYYQKLQYLVK